MPIGRPFIDAKGKRGTPKLTSKTISGTKPEKTIRFEQYSATHLRLIIPGRKIFVNKNRLIELAHWLLDKCTTRRE